MNKTNYTGLLFCIALFIGFGSCTKKEDPNPFEAVGDVYYVNKKNGNEKQTSLAFYAFGNKAINTAIVSTPVGEQVELDKSMANSFTRFYEPNETDFSNNYPAEGNYVFNLKSSDGDKLQHTDILNKKNLEIPTITHVVFEDNDFSYDVEWEADSKTNAFILELYDSDETLVFTSEKIEGTERVFTLIESDLGVWEKEIIVGNTYEIRLIAFVYEDSSDAYAEPGTLNSQELNIQEISINEVKFVWSEN